MGGRTHGKTTETVLQEIKNIHGNKFLYDKFVYKNSKTKVEIGCIQHGYFKKYPNDIKKSNGGCPKCNNSWYKTHNEFVNELPAHITTVDAYINAKTKMKFYCVTHKYEFVTTPNGILSGHISCPECSAAKSISSKLSISQSIADPLTKSEYELYYQTVWRYSNRSYKKHMSSQLRNRQLHLDHVLSILEGFKQNVPPEIIGSQFNLRIIPAKQNRQKSYKSEITADELIERFTCGI